MYTQAQGNTNHGPKKIDWSKRAEWDQLTHPPPIPELNSSFRTPTPLVFPSFLWAGSKWSSADGVSDIGHFHILVRQVVTAELEHQRFHVLAQLLFGHLSHDLCHPAGHTEENDLDDDFNKW